MGAQGTVNNQQVLVDLVRRIDPSDAARRLVTRFRAEIPAYQHLPDILMETVVTEMVRQNLEAFARTVVEGRATVESDLSPFALSAEQRAIEDFPLEDLIHAYRLGGRILWQELADAAAPEERDSLPQIADLVMGYIDAVCAKVTRSYLGRAANHVSESERRIRDLVGALSSPEPLLPVDYELADLLGFEVCTSYRPFVAVIPGAPRGAHAGLAARLRSRGVLTLTEADRVVGFLRPDAEPPQETGGLVLAGSSVPREDLAGALDDMRLIADLSKLYGHQRPLTVEEFLPDLLLARSPHLASALRERVLGPLEDYERRRETDLMGSLETLLACQLDRRTAAGKLHVHRNTLDYRVHRAEELAGIELSRPHDLVLLTLAFRQRDLEAARRRAAAAAA